MSKTLRLALTAALVIANCNVMCWADDSQANQSVTQTGKKRGGVYEEVLIKASPKVVWQSLLQQRKTDPDSAYLKPVGAEAVEQKFVFPSPFGSAECVLHLADTPAERVDFKMIQSEDLKAMEGSWVLTPVDDGKSTKLGLSSYLEPNMSIPRIITNGLVSHRCKHNLGVVKKLAEGTSSKSM